MAKDSFYFSHDYNTREDEKIKELIYEHGFEGYGLYWAIVEMLYQNANALRTNYKRIAFELRSDEKTIESIINDFNLFEVEDEFFYSVSVKRRLEERDQKSKKARDNALSRWKKSDSNANAMQTHSESNAIKERKVKEIKEKESKENEQIDYDKVEEFILLQQQKLQLVAMQNKLLPEVIIDKVRAFIVHCRIEETKWVNNEDAFKHFKNWLPIHLDKNKKTAVNSDITPTRKLRKL